MHIQQIEKIQIASEQLEDALSAYVAGRFHSALVLASAAEQLYAGYVMKHDETPAKALFPTSFNTVMSSRTPNPAADPLQRASPAFAGG